MHVLNVNHHVDLNCRQCRQTGALSPLLFMGRRRTATLTLASSRLGSPMLALYPGGGEVTLIQNKPAPSAKQASKSLEMLR